MNNVIREETVSIEYLCDSYYYFWNNDTSEIMDPAAGDSQVIPFSVDGVVDLVAIRKAYAMESFQEFSRVIRFAGLLIIIQDKRVILIFPGTVDPHVAL